MSVRRERHLSSLGAQARQGAAELAALQRQREAEARAGRPAAPAPDNVLGHWVQRSEASRLTVRRLPSITLWLLGVRILVELTVPAPVAVLDDGSSAARRRASRCGHIQAKGCL